MRFLEDDLIMHFSSDNVIKYCFVLFCFAENITGSCMLNNAANTGTVLTSTFINTSAIHCQLECLMKLGCVQFNFNITSGQCCLLANFGINQNVVSITGPKICGDYSSALPSSKVS